MSEIFNATTYYIFVFGALGMAVWLIYNLGVLKSEAEYYKKTKAYYDLCWSLIKLAQNENAEEIKKLRKTVNDNKKNKEELEIQIKELHQQIGELKDEINILEYKNEKLRRQKENNDEIQR